MGYPDMLNQFRDELLANIEAEFTGLQTLEEKLDWFKEKYLSDRCELDDDEVSFDDNRKILKANLRLFLGSIIDEIDSNESFILAINALREINFKFTKVPRMDKD